MQGVNKILELWKINGPTAETEWDPQIERSNVDGILAVDGRNIIHEKQRLAKIRDFSDG